MISIDSARYYLEKAATPTSNSYTLIDCFYLGYLIEKEAGDTERALCLLEQYQEKKDSLYNEQMQVDIVDAEKRHDVVTVVQENRELVVEKRFLLAFAVIICLLLVVGYQMRDKKRLLEINQRQKFLEEEKRHHKRLKLDVFVQLERLTEDGTTTYDYT